MLNTEHFELLAGNPTKWDEETRNRVAAGESLPNVQISQHARGRLGAQLQDTIYGFSVRYSSGLDNWGLLYGSRTAGHNVTREEAIAWGKQWAEKDPENREFIAYKEKQP